MDNLKIAVTIFSVVGLSSVITVRAADAASFTFKQGSFTDGGTLSGTFTGQDVNGDGIIDSRELTSLSLSWLGTTLEIPSFTQKNSVPLSFYYQLPTATNSNSHNLKFWVEFYIQSSFGDEQVVVDFRTANAFGGTEIQTLGESNGITTSSSTPTVNLVAVPEPRFALAVVSAGLLLLSSSPKRP